MWMQSGPGGSFGFGLTKRESDILHKLHALAYQDTYLVEEAINKCAKRHPRKTLVDKILFRAPSKKSSYPYSKLSDIVQYIKENRRS